MTSLQQGIDALRAGQPDTARKFLAAAIKENPNDERAWQWMYNAVKEDKERTYCLKQILRINPKNNKAIQILSQLTSSTPALPKKHPSALTKQRFSQQQNILIGLGSFLFICCLCIGIWSLFSPSNDNEKTSFTPTPSDSAPMFSPTQPIKSSCNPAYPDVCIIYDQTCKELKAQGISNFKVLPPDPFGFDKDNDGIGCEN